MILNKYRWLNTNLPAIILGTYQDNKQEEASVIIDKQAVNNI